MAILGSGLPRHSRVAGEAAGGVGGGRAAQEHQNSYGINMSIMTQTAHVTIISVFALMLLRPARAGDLARIYVYVQLETPARSWFPVSCDGAVVAEIKRGRFFAIDVAPGRHMLTEEKGVPTFVDARSGQESFVRLNWHFEVGKPAIPVWQVVQPSTARNDMICLTYIDAGKAVSRLVPKRDPRGPPRLTRRHETNDE